MSECVCVKTHCNLVCNYLLLLFKPQASEVLQMMFTLYIYTVKRHACSRSAAQKRCPGHGGFAVFPALPSDVPPCPVQLAPRRRLHSLQHEGTAVPPADRRRGCQAGMVRVSGPGVGPQLDGDAVPAGGAEQVSGFLAGTSTQASSGGFHHLDLAYLASVGLNGDFTSWMAAVK